MTVNHKNVLTLEKAEAPRKGHTMTLTWTPGEWPAGPIVDAAIEYAASHDVVSLSIYSAGRIINGQFRLMRLWAGESNVWVASDDVPFGAARGLAAVLRQLGFEGVRP